jgi:hypothetical protein
LLSPHHFATEGVALELHAITDAEHGDGASEEPFGELGGAVVIDAGWPTREDDATDIVLKNDAGRGVVGDEFGINTDFAQAPYD